MACGKVSLVLGRLALPLMISLFFQNLYSYADTVYVSWLGEIPLAAVSIAVPLTYLALALAKGVAMGGVVLMSFSRGAADEFEYRRIAESLLPLMILFMSVFVPLMIPSVGKSFYQWMGVNVQIAEQGTGFLFWLVLSFFPMGYLFCAEAIFTANGDTFTPMKAMIFGNVLNIALDPLFIFVFGLGVTGAAVATFLGQYLAAIYLSRQLKRQFSGSLQWKAASQSILYWRKILKQGLFVSAAYMISPVALMMLNGILVRYGAAAVGAWNLMSRTEMMIMLPIMGLSNALASFVGFNLGRLDYDRIRQAVRFFFFASWLIIIPAALLFFLFPQLLLFLFQPGPELALLGAAALQASALSMFFSPFLFAVAGLSQGAKRPVYMMSLMFVYLICLRIPLAHILGEQGGREGIYWSHPLATALAVLPSGLLLYLLLQQCQKQIETTNQAREGR